MRTSSVGVESLGIQRIEVRNGCLGSTVASPGQRLRSASFSARGALSPYRIAISSSSSATWSSMDSKPSAAVPRGHAAVSEAKKPNEISIHGFRVLTQKQPILKADPIEEMTKKLGIAPPEMIFGDNYVAIEHEKSGWAINFNSFDALDLVDKTGQSMLQVAYSKEWQKSRYISQTPIHYSSAVP